MLSNTTVSAAVGNLAAERFAVAAPARIASRAVSRRPSASRRDLFA